MEKFITYKNWDINLYLFTNWNWWAFPFAVYWSYYNAITGKCFSIDFDLLCFGFEIEIWKWLIQEQNNDK